MKRRIFFAVDLHGATSVWRKCLQAPAMYNIDVLLLCGDLTGKILVPIIEQKNGDYKIPYLSKNKIIEKNKLSEMEGILAASGAYYIKLKNEELFSLEKNPSIVAETIKRLIEERINEWLNLLIEKVDTKKTLVVVMPGNDDGYYVDPIIKSFSEAGVQWCLNRTIEVSGAEIISLPDVNPTIWKTPREMDESKLSITIESLVKLLKNPEKAIFNFHCPPYGTRIDLAPELNKVGKPITVAGHLNYVHAGSSAVRLAIEKYKPLLGLHGHIHESPGVDLIGKTICINPGSEYGEGIMKSYIIDLENGQVMNYWKAEG